MAAHTLTARSFSRLFAPPRTNGPDGSDIRRYYAVVPLADIPREWANWLEVNAREASDKGKVPRAIRSTLTEKPEWFVAYNRGLTVVASHVHWDNKTSRLTLRFADPNYHGVLDGGHTLQAILGERERLGTEEKQEGFCNIEIFTGLEESEIPDVVDARNTSKQVESKSLLNLRDRFEGLKAAIGQKQDLIAWMENADKDFDVREVIGILTALDPSTVTENVQPVKAYSGKEACLKRFEQNPETYSKLYGIASDALELWDAIHYYLPDQYNKKGPEPNTTGKGGKFGKFKGVKSDAARELPFIGKKTRFSIPSGYIYPVLSAFRAMLVEKDGQWTWGKGIDPVKLVQQGVAADIFIKSVRESHNNYHNPNRTGKDTQAWSMAYMAALIIYMQHGAPTTA